MVLRLARPLALATLTLGVACNCGNKADADGGSTTPESAASRSAPNGDSYVLDAIESLGNEGAFVVVLRPDQWSELHGALLPWLNTLPSQAAPLRDATTPDKIPGLLAYPLGLPPDKVRLEGWDMQRPIVASLAEVPYQGPPGAVTAALPVLEGKMLPLRSQVLVPSTDTAALVRSMTGVLNEIGEPMPALVEGRPGAGSFQVGDNLTVAVLPQEGAVRVVLLARSSGMNDAQRLEAMRARLDPEPAAPLQTPGLSLVSQPKVAVAGWTRSWRLRPLMTWSGGSMVVEALQTVARDQRSVLRAKGLQIVLSTELLMADAGAEFDDAATALVVDEGTLRLGAAMSLTPKGAEILQAGRDGASKPFVVKATDAWLDVAMPVDLGAMLKTAEPLAPLAGAQSPGEAAEAVREGGPPLALYLALRHPFGTLKVAQTLASTQTLPVSVETLPTALHLVWQGLDGDKPRGALAAQWPKGYTTEPLRGVVSLLGADRDFESLRMDRTERDDAPATLFAMGVDPQAVFDGTASGKGDGVMQATIHLDRIAAAMTRLEPELGSVMPKGQAKMRWEQRDKALVGQLAWNPAGTEAEPSKVALDTSPDWKSPAGDPSDSEGVKCLADAGRGIGGALGALATVAPDQRATIMAKALSEVEAPLRCAAGDAMTAEAGARLRRILARALSDTLLQGHDGTGALRLLEQQCSTSKDEAICGMRDRLAALPQPRVPDVELHTSCRSDYGSPTGDFDIIIDAKSIALDGESVTVTDLPVRLASLVERLAKQQREQDEMWGGLPDEGWTPTAGLVVDQEVLMARIRPVLAAIVASGIERVVIIVSESGSRGQSVTVPIVDRSPKATGGGTPAGKGVGAMGRGPVDHSRGGTPPGEGVGAMGRGPVDHSRVGILRTLGGAHAVSTWVKYEVGRGTVTVHSDTQPEPQVLTTPTAAALRKPLESFIPAYVHATDRATWKDLAITLAATCPDATLVLKPDTP